MARKITIRRVGTIFPALCLVVVVFITVIIIWLSAIGLPDQALRKIEAKAAEYGLEVRIGAIRLALSSGLAFKVENTRLSLPCGESDKAEIAFRKLLVDYNIFELANGQKTPSDVQLMDASATLPLGQGEKLEATKLNTTLHFFNKGTHLILNSTGRFQGVRLNLRADFPLLQGDTDEEATAVESSQPDENQVIPNLAEILEPVLPQLRRVYTEIARQQWSDRNAPSLDVRLRLRDSSPDADITAEIPDYRLGDIHFRRASLNFRIEDDSYIINKLSFFTEEPYSEVTLRGGYDRTLRQLSFTAESNAALLRIAEAYYGKKFDGVLAKVYPNKMNTPRISLRGNVDFSEDFALNSITLRGKLEQNEFRIGDSDIRKLLLSFFVSDGNFNIDKLRMELPDGYLEASAASGNGRGQAAVRFLLPMPTLRQLVSDFSGSPLTLPEGISAEGNVDFSAAANMNVSEFIPGKTRIEDLLPELRTLTAEVKVDTLNLNGTRLESPNLELNLDGIVQPSAQNKELRIGALRLSAGSKRLSLPDEGGAAEDVSICCQLGGFNVTDLHELTKTLSIDEANMTGSIETLQRGNARMEGLSFRLDDVRHFRADKPWQQLPVDTKATLNIRALGRPDDMHITDARVDILPQSNDSGIIASTMKIGEREMSSRISLDYSDTMQSGRLGFALDDTDIPLGELAPLLEPFISEMRDIELPQLVRLGAEGNVNLHTGHLSDTRVRLRLPELVRTPYTVPVHRGMKIPLEIEADALLNHNTEGELLYQADFAIRHGGQAFTGKADGNLAHFCHITGNSDIQVDIINALIDDIDAHSIMRDFRFADNSATRINNIDTTIRYDRGLQIDSFCKARLLNTDFLIGAILTKYNGKGQAIGEELRTDMGRNPYSRVFEASCGVRVHVRLGCSAEDGSTLPDNAQVILISPYLNYDNRPWLQRTGNKKGTRSSIIKGDFIVFNLNDNGIDLYNLEGLCYPAYAFGMYFAPLQQYMADIKLEKPVRVHTQRCTFPIAMSSEVPISGLIRVEAPRGAQFHFIGTDIPLKNFSGFVNLSNDYVFLDKLNAETWQGVLNGAVKIGISSPRTTIDGQLRATNLNLKDIAAAYDTKLSPALCNGSIRFRADSPELNYIRAYGEVSVSDGDLLQLGIFQPVGSLISDLPGYLIQLQSKVTGKTQEEILRKKEEEAGVFNRLLRFIFLTTDNTIDSMDSSTRYIPFANHFMRYDIQQASAKFDISNGYLYTRDMKASGYNLDVDMKLRLNLDTLELRGNLWPTISSVPTAIVAPITFLSDYLIDIVLYGTIENIQWKFTLDRIMRGAKRRPSVTEANRDKQDKKH